MKLLGSGNEPADKANGEDQEPPTGRELEFAEHKEVTEFVDTNNEEFAETKNPEHAETKNSELAEGQGKKKKPSAPRKKESAKPSDTEAENEAALLPPEEGQVARVHSDGQTRSSSGTIQSTATAPLPTRREQAKFLEMLRPNVKKPGDLRKPKSQKKRGRCSCLRKASPYLAAVVLAATVMGVVHFTGYDITDLIIGVFYPNSTSTPISTVIADDEYDD